MWGMVVSSKRPRQKGRDPGGPTLEGLTGAMIALVPAYVTSESFLAALPHLTHWVGTGAGLLVGYVVGSLVAAYREQRVPFAPRERPGQGAKRRQRHDAPTRTQSQPARTTRKR